MRSPSTVTGNLSASASTFFNQAVRIEHSLCHFRIRVLLTSSKNCLRVILCSGVRAEKQAMMLLDEMNPSARRNSRTDDINTAAAGEGNVGGTAPTLSQRCGLAALMKTHMKRIADLTDPFFSSSGEGGDDRFVDLVRLDPQAASRLIRAVMAVSVLGSVDACVGNASFLFQHWDSCDGWDKPMRKWLLVYCILQALQIPLRLGFFAKIGMAEGAGLEPCVAFLTTSPAWRMSEFLALSNYGLHILGIIWLLNAYHLITCTGIYKMMIVAYVQAAVRGLAGAVCFRVLFPQGAPRPSPPKAKGADPDQISRLPLVRFRKNGLADENPSCVICLSEYEHGEKLRELPCGHQFHCVCVDRWLRQRQQCPLCMGAIDQ